MPESKSSRRKKVTYTAPPAKADLAPTPQWYKVLMLTLLVVGLVWVVVTYLSGGKYPIASWHNWNLLMGFGLMLVGFGMMTRWR